MRLFDLAGSLPANRASLISAVLDHDVFPRLVAPGNETSSEPEVSRKRADDLDALVDREARRLRTTFAGCVRDRDYAGALAIGGEIIRVLPDHSLAADFRHIKPHLHKRLDSAAAK